MASNEELELRVAKLERQVRELMGRLSDPTRLQAGDPAVLNPGGYFPGMMTPPPVRVDPQPLQRPLPLYQKMAF